MAGKALVLDANILVRAVLGQRVRELIEAYAEEVSFFVPEEAYNEAAEHLPELALRHAGDPDKVLAVLTGQGYPQPTWWNVNLLKKMKWNRNHPKTATIAILS